MKKVQIIKCLSENKDYNKKLKTLITYKPSTEYARIFSDEILTKFVGCLEKIYKETGFEPEERNITELFDAVIENPIMKYLFLLFIYNEAFSKDKEYFIENSLEYLSDSFYDWPSKGSTSGCLCLNKEDDSILGDGPIKDLKMSELYLLPSGRCIKIQDLIAHINTSDNKFLDPTSPLGVKDKLWENGLDLQRLLNTLISFDYNEGTKIKDIFEQVLKVETDKISKEMKDLLSETYFLFYFAETKDAFLSGEEGDLSHAKDRALELVKQMLKKYKFPDLEKFDQKALDKLFPNTYGWQEAFNDDISQFRSLLGFKIGYKILEELPPEEKESILFIGEFCGFAKEGWASLAMGTFCTKTYGSLVHRISNVINGVY